MCTASKENKAGLIFATYAKILARLPRTYPRPELTVYSSYDAMCQTYSLDVGDGRTCLGATVPELGIILAPLDEIGDTADDIALVLLHELAHLWALHRYGPDCPQYHDEEWCDKWAARWWRRMQDETA